MKTYRNVRLSTDMRESIDLEEMVEFDEEPIAEAEFSEEGMEEIVISETEE